MDWKNAGRKVFKLTMTQGQVTYLTQSLRQTNEFWERLSDITGITPQWLKENINSFPMDFVSPSEFNAALKEGLDETIDRVIVVRPVSQDKSGELTRIV